nr:hypothetical protein CFP56_62320 [Quercus suber]
MTTRFSKQKLVEAQEKKARSGTVSGLLSKKKTGDVSKKDPVTTIPPAYSPVKSPASPISSLEIIASGRKEIRKKKKAGGKFFLPTFWDDVDAVALKAHEAFSMDDLSPLMVKSSTKNDKERVATLEKSLQMEKDFCKLKDKQIGNLELKLENVVATVVQDFKDFDEYSDELCKYYVEGFDLLVKWMAKHHLGLDLFVLAVDDVEKELISSEATTKNVTEEATNVAEGMKEATVITPANPIPDEQ